MATGMRRSPTVITTAKVQAHGACCHCIHRKFSYNRSVLHEEQRARPFRSLVVGSR